MNHVYQNIMNERERQDLIWGGPYHDDLHRQTDWADYISEHLDKALNAPTIEDYIRRMTEVAALAVAAIESQERLVKANA